MNLYKKLKYYSPYLLRKRFKSKYIIIESDDWGLERALTADTIEWMKKKFGEENFTRWSLDSLESSEDLNFLFEVFEKFKNKFEFPPVITANFITHNIDYTSRDKLKFIPLSKGFNKESGDVRNQYKEGIRNGFIFPQLHGFCHYNKTDLENYFETPEGKESFNEKFFVAKSTIKSYSDANLYFLHGEFKDSNSKINFLKAATDEFENFFGFKSKSIIPPTYILDREYLKILRENNISLLQASNRLMTSNRELYLFYYFRKNNGLFCSIRNARLDPDEKYKFYHEQCIDSIGKAFENKVPAVIDFHRVNFAGRYNRKYRDRTLKELKLLFDKIHVKWPEAKFIHTEKLNELLTMNEDL